jgi:tetratricopeptide (TPR) repeat protein
MTMTMDTAATTDHVMYLKQQELIAKSHSAFEEGKRNLLDKNYKEAIKSFSLSLKYCNANKDSKYYRAICYLDNENSKKCINDLNELIEIDPGYNQTVYIVLSIAYRRENDLNNSLKAVNNIILHVIWNIVNERHLEIPKIRRSLSSKRIDPHLFEEI